MSLKIDDPSTENVARELAATTGESVTEAVRLALTERLERIRKLAPEAGLASRILEIGARCAALPDLDKRSTDEILGYNDQGRPT